VAERRGFRIVWFEDRPDPDLDLARSLLPDGFSVNLVSPRSTNLQQGRPGELMMEADAILVQRSPVSAQLLDLAPAVRLVQLYGVRDEGIDRAAAQRRGVTVAVMPLRGCIAVAELAMTLVLALSKRLTWAHQVTAEGRYRGLGLEPRQTNQTTHAFQWMRLADVFEVSGTTLGIIGLGEIGTEVAKRARAFGMNVTYNKRSRLPLSSERELEVTWRDRDELLRSSDFVLLALPYADSVRHLIGRRELDLMKQSAFLINVARGPLVDETALVDALDRSVIAGAGLDVFTEEPLPFDSPLAASDRVILTPHIGGGSGGAREKQLGDVLSNITQFANTGHAQHEVPISLGADDARD
jgi:phosphoglycerate dehydrogenase-like enzyme